MKFGKLYNLSTVDFTLPKDIQQTTKVLSNLPQRTKAPTIYIGCTGWSMKEWVGRVYPKGTKTTDYLKQYVRQFNTIELNTTHYRIPTKKTIDLWRETASKGFKFSPKIPQAISHDKDLGMNTNLTKLFCEEISGLKANLGCSFMQLPPYFGIERLPMLELFLKQFPNHIPLAIEVRHPSWFENEHNFNQLFDLLKSYNQSLVITDVAGRRDVLHQGITNQTTMIRFVGNATTTELHPTDYTRIDAWVDRMKTWFEQGLEEVYFFTHEPDNLLAPELAIYLSKKIKEVMPTVVTCFPELIKEDEQMTLF